MLSPVRYRVEHGQPVTRGGRSPDVPPGMIPIATFDAAHRADPEYTWFVVFASRE